MQEFGWPLILLTVDNNIVRTIAIVGMVLFHLNITSMFPLAVPLEWNIFMIFGTLFLFGHYGDVPLSTLDDPLLIAMIAVALRRPAAAGRPAPGQGLLPALDALLRRQLGDHAVAVPQGQRRGGRSSTRGSRSRRGMVGEQVAKIYDPEMAEFLLNKGLAFRAMHSHGRALNALLPHAVEDVEAYDAREGELISNIVNGWNFGDGHFHGRQLLEAVQERCGFAPGRGAGDRARVRGGRQRAPALPHLRRGDGLVEEGSVAVADMVERQPWLDESWDFPVEVTRRRSPRSAAPGLVSDGDGRRLRPQRAGLRGGAGPGRACG